MRGSDERQTATVSRTQNEPFTITSGLDHLTVLKTSNSAFHGYIKDALTTLPETTDRLFGTALKATWPYTPAAIEAGIDFNKVRSHLREALITTFAKHDSLSVQTDPLRHGRVRPRPHHPHRRDLHAHAQQAQPLDLVDLSRFGQTNPNHIFVPTDEPHGTIEATIRRA